MVVNSNYFKALGSYFYLLIFGTPPPTYVKIAWLCDKFMTDRTEQNVKRDTLEDLTVQVTIDNDDDNEINIEQYSNFQC
jgi:hypothetical protein